MKTSTENTLLELADQHFEELTKAEIKLFTAIPSGQTIEISDKEPFENYRIREDDDICIDAGKIEWLLVNPEAQKFIPTTGLNIKGAWISEELNLQYSQANYPLTFNECAFDSEIQMTYFSCIGVLGFANCLILGSIALTGSHIKGQLNLNGTTIVENPELEYSIGLFNATIDHLVSLTEGFKSFGEVYLYGTKIGGSLDCNGSSFINPKGRSLNLEYCQVGEIVHLNNNFSAEGTVNLLGAKINGSLDCGGANLDKGSPENEYALRAIKATIGRDVFLDKGIDDPNNTIQIKGKVDFSKAEIGKSFTIKDIMDKSDYQLWLKDTSIGTLNDDQSGWPLQDQLYVEGLRYQFIDFDSPRSHRERGIWLKLQENYSPYPYRQLAHVLDEMGCEQYARNIRIIMNEEWKKDEAAKKGIFNLRHIWKWFLGVFISYGYKPFKVWKPALVIWLLGALIYFMAFQNDMIKPPARTAWQAAEQGQPAYQNLYPHYHKFQPLVYSLDVFLPIVNLHQESYWLPKANQKEIVSYVLFNGNLESETDNATEVKITVGGLVRFWMYFQILSGWFLTTMLIGGISGLLKQK